MKKNREPSILHSDCNCFYASVEMLHHPELRNVPMAVGGDTESRHGIVLTANYPAKRMGIQTGMVLWKARQICPDIRFVPPHYDQYLAFSRMAHEIYAEYTDRQEPFGIDECWLDVTESIGILGDALSMAREIRQRIRRELGITVSIGVSFDKIYAKLGSDYQKPDAVTDMGREEFQKKAWPLPVSDLLYVGPATKRKLAKIGIFTIGDLAEADTRLLSGHLGKAGLMLHAFAAGEDRTPVAKEGTVPSVKSIGNGITTPRDLFTCEEVRVVLAALAESVAARLRENGFRAGVLEVSVRRGNLTGYTRQRKLFRSTDLTREISDIACEIFTQDVQGKRFLKEPVRALGIRAGGLVTAAKEEQLDLFTCEEDREKRRRVDRAVDDIRRRFGYYSIQRGIMLRNPELSHLNAKEENTVHPESFFHAGEKMA